MTTEAALLKRLKDGADVLSRNHRVLATDARLSTATAPHALEVLALAADDNVDEVRITDFVVFEPANAIKFTIRRERPSGSAGETDLFGCQQYAPLFDLDIP